MARLPKVRRIFSTTDELMLAAEEGDAQAQNELAMAMATGSGVKQDRRKAFEWWQKAADGSDPVAMERLGDVFRTGEILLEKVTPIDRDRAILWYKQAVKFGNPNALFGLALVYQQQQELALAAEAFRQSAYVYGKRESLREYGMCLYHGNGLRADQEKGREIIADAALMDQEFSLLGCKYLADNYGVKLEMPKNDEERQQRKYALDRFQFGCLLKRAESGDLDAQVEIAHKYIFGGKQTEMNRDKAYFWFTRAAEAGDAEAQYEIGRAAEAGAGGLRRDISDAYAWFAKSAAQGYREALREAGRCLYFGEGVEQNLSAAAAHFERAVKQRDTESMVFLGKMLQDGLGVKKDAERGKALIARALEEDKKGIGLARLRLEQLESRPPEKPKKKK